MIKIQRIACPGCLDINIRNLIATDYSQDDVLEALLRMQYFKCCYCEKDLTKLGGSALWVEHFIAKDDNCFKDIHGNVNWDQANNWNNLLYSCSTCNRSKGTDKPFDISGKRRLIDPSYSRIDPERHIDFFIDDEIIFYKEKNHSGLGRNTIRNLKLKRRNDVYALLRKTKIKIDALFGELVDALTDGNTLEVNAKINELIRTTSAHRPHAAFCRKYIQQKITNFNNRHLNLINKQLGLQLNPISLNIASGFQTII